ncbi:hypothetical protein DRE_04218 [Drechslerella stenobrocha 248]|uniref:Peptidase C14 caspase domain-containing protein n=1 Tax=Drechslerella stenobrocha 248 TaxID=1043628 RepID=W7IBR7_9PEZI|nr:hypothetical protein DRE_04218 [Drechslerella stenobrocha 248]
MAHNPERWALLIGIDFYFAAEAGEAKTRSLKFHHLTGCVRDVRGIEKHLQSIGVCTTRITKLTASKGESESKPKEDPRSLPTHSNIIRELDRITRSASPGDLIYIHYSGHGVRRNVLASAGTSGEGGDEFSGAAFAPTDVMIGGAYLTGYHLGDMVKQMVEQKKLRVTLTLDCCFSGRGLRRSESYTVRTPPGAVDNSVLPSDEQADRAIAAITGPTSASDPKTRNAMFKPCWLSNPVGCTVLTACQFNQAAGEDRFADAGGKHGVLTYWMLNILQKCSGGPTPSFSRVKEHVEVKIKSMRPRLAQSPVLHGDGDYAFFGKELVIERPACHVLSVYDDCVDLDIGRAQGAAEGAIYEIYPEGCDIDSPNATPIEAHIIELDGFSDFRSTARLEHPDHPMHRGATIKPGCRAMLQTWALESDTFVQWNPPEGRPDLAGFEDVLKTYIEKTPGLYLNSDFASEPTFTISVHPQHKTFEIYENGKRLARLPRIVSKDVEQQAESLAYALRRVARFRDIKRLGNDDGCNPLEPGSFLFQLHGESGEHLRKDTDGVYRVVDGQSVTISFKLLNSRNRESDLDSVDVAFFNLNPSWGIQKLYPGPGQSVHKTHEKSTERFSIQMSIPQRTSAEDPEEIEDTIRAYVYAGDQPPSWDELVLEDLPVEDTLIPLDFRIDAIKTQEPQKKPAMQRNAGVNGRSTKEPRWGVLDIKIRTIPRTSSPS